MEANWTHIANILKLDLKVLDLFHLYFMANLTHFEVKLDIPVQRRVELTGSSYCVMAHGIDVEHR